MTLISRVIIQFDKVLHAIIRSPWDNSMAPMGEGMRDLSQRYCGSVLALTASTNLMKKKTYILYWAKDHKKVIYIERHVVEHLRVIIEN